MRKIEIVTRIADAAGLTKVKAEQAVDAILEDYLRAVLAGSIVSYETAHTRGNCFASSRVASPLLAQSSIPKSHKGAALQFIASCRFSKREGIDFFLRLLQPAI